MTQHGKFLWASLAAALTLATGSAQTQGNKTVRIVAPFAAGGGRTSWFARCRSNSAPPLGQTVIVENRPGAGGTVGTVGTVGTGMVAKAEPDGNLMVMAAASHNIAGSPTTRRKTSRRWPTSAPPAMC